MIVDNVDLPYLYHILYRGSKDGVKGKQIERYYDDFKHVRIVPFFALREKIETKSHEQFGSLVAGYYALGQNPNHETFLENPGHHTVEYAYRSLVKMNWLINDIQARGCREPISGVIRPKGDGWEVDVHPGTFRRHAFDIMDLDQPCIIFDAFEVFPEYPKASLSDILELFTDPSGSDIEISMLPRDTSYQTPQILNMHSKGINCSMAPTMREWEEKSREMFSGPLNIFIGYDSRHYDATNVCHNSIFDNLPVHVRQHVNIVHLDTSKIDGWTREYKDQSTEFTYSRFLCPYLSNYEGISIFCDDDFIFRENILNLLFFIAHDQAVACVKHDFKEVSDVKFNSEKNVSYPKKLWSSLMVFNNTHPDCKKLTLESVQEQSGKYLHQFEWTDEGKIGSIPSKWNWCEGYSELTELYKSYGLHFTRGGPWIDDMDCSNLAGIEFYELYRIKHLVGLDQERFTYHPKNISMLDMRQYYDLDNPIERTEDDCLICQEINRDVR